MIRRLLRIALVLAALKAVGAVLARRLNRGLEVDANEFSIATAFGGVDRESRATALRRGDVLASVASRRGDGHARRDPGDDRRGRRGGRRVGYGRR